MTAEYKKELPPITLATKPFWLAAKRHELMAYKCLNCGTYYWPAVDCMACHSPKMQWVKVSGKGEIYTYTVMHQLYQPGWQDEIPYNISWVKLDEGPIFMSNVVGCPNEDIKIGMRVEVVFDDVTDEVTLPKFRPAPPAGG
jgi:uncharacterized OB-fold protein